MWRARVTTRRRGTETVFEIPLSSLVDGADQALKPNEATNVKSTDLFSSLVTTKSSYKPGGTSVSTRT